jgi:hypothetical protein
VDPNTYWVSQTKNVVDLLVGLAWPIVAMVALIVYRRHLVALVGRIREGELLGTKWKFDPTEAEPAVALATTAALGTAIPPWSSGAEVSLELGELAKSQPELAVIGAYGRVERALKERMEESSIPSTEPPLVGMRLIDAAVEAGVIAWPLAEAMRRLRQLRNTAAHGGTVETAKALDYIALCDQVLYILELDRGS